MVTYALCGFFWAVIYRLHDIANYEEPDSNKEALHAFMANIVLWPLIMLGIAHKVLFTNKWQEEKDEDN